MPICNESGLMTKIMFDVKDKVNTAVAETWRWLTPFSNVLEGFILMELIEFHKNMTIRKLHRDTTLEYTLLTGVGVLCPSATSWAL